MEDRYLFKAKRIDNGEWVQGCYIYDVDRDCSESLNEFAHRIQPLYAHAYAEPVDSSTICQCTGLKDMNGNLIWEGDIVGYYEEYNQKWHYGLVSYGEFNCSCCNGVYGWHFGNEDIREYKGCEVKGNIFDNPELLESEG